MRVAGWCCGNASAARNYQGNAGLRLKGTLLAGMRMEFSWRGTALLATLGVVLVALFPAGAGPFTATQGPVTALRAIAFLVLLLFILGFLLVTRAVARELLLCQQTSAAARICKRKTILSLRC